MPPRITLRPSGSVSMVAYQRWSASVKGSAAPPPVAGVSSVLASGELPPVIISRPSASQAEVLQKLLTRAASTLVWWLAAPKPSDALQRS
jgi:hypothetical protein